MRLWNYDISYTFFLKLSCKSKFLYNFMLLAHIFLIYVIDLSPRDYMGLGSELLLTCIVAIP